MRSTCGDFRMANDRTLSLDRLLTLLREVRQPDPELAEVANKLVPEAGRYLHEHHIGLLVRDEISETEVRRELQRQKKFVARLEDLLPSLLQYLKLEDAQALKSTLHVIDDCFTDHSFIMSAPRQDRALRNAIADIKKAQETLLDAEAALSALNFALTADMDDFLDSFESVARRADSYGGSSRSFLDSYTQALRRTSSQKFDEFLEQLQLRSQILEICLFRAQNEEGYLFLTDNQAKKHIVENAYRLCLWREGPRLVTTPGSEFSTFCSLLYEIVSGKSTNEGLAGAINRFARSKERREEDAHHAEMQREPDRSDNFLEKKEEAQKALDELATYTRLLKASEQLGEKQRLIIHAAALRAKTRAFSALNAYGPYIVWFSDVAASSPLRTLDVDLEGRYAALRKDEKERWIALGEARRRQRSKG